MDTLDIALVEPKTAAGKRRAETLRQLHRDGAIPTYWYVKAKQEVDKPIPSTSLQREHMGAWVRVWDRPQRHDAGPITDAAFDALVSAYDQQTERNAYFDERQREREHQAADRQRERDAEDAAKREEEASELKERLRRQYLSLTGTTPEGFEQDFPQLLQDHRRRELERTSDTVEAEMRRAVRQAIS